MKIQASVGNYSDKVWGGKRLYTTLGDFQNNEQGMKKMEDAKKIKDTTFWREKINNISMSKDTKN